MKYFCLLLYSRFGNGVPMVTKLVLKNTYIRLKKINSMSQSCRAHLFFGARLIQRNSRFEFFFACLIFFQFFMNLLVKIYKKRYDRHNETLWTTDFFNSVFCLVSCSSKIKFHISKLWTTQIWYVCCSEKKKKKL